MSLQVTQEEAERWNAHLNNSKRCINDNSKRCTPIWKLDKARQMLQAGESKTQIRKHVHIGGEKIDQLKREMIREGAL